jgi:hypothetical protein
VQTPETVFAGSIRGVLRKPNVVSHAANADERPPPGPAHDGEECPGYVEGRLDVRGQLHLEVRCIGSLDGPEQERSGIAHDDVRRAVLRDDPRCQTHHLVRMGQIRWKVLNPVA